MEFLGMDSGDTMYVVMAIVVLICGVLLVKKVAGCLVKLVVLAIMAAIIYVLYMSYTAEEAEGEEEPAVEMID